jgi:type IV secretory pathway protease TraF
MITKEKIDRIFSLQGKIKETFDNVYYGIIPVKPVKPIKPSKPKVTITIVKTEEKSKPVKKTISLNDFLVRK